MAVVVAVVAVVVAVVVAMAAVIAIAAMYSFWKIDLVAIASARGKKHYVVVGLATIAFSEWGV